MDHKTPLVELKTPNYFKYDFQLNYECLEFYYKTYTDREVVVENGYSYAIKTLECYIYAVIALEF